MKIFSFVKSLLLAPFLILQNEIIHIHTASNFSFFRKSFFVILTKSMNRKLILHIHGGGFAQFIAKQYRNRYKKIIISYLLKLPDRIICLSKTKAFEIENFVLSKKICIIPNPAPYPNHFKNNKKKNNDEIIIFFAGWIEKEKGIFDLILAFFEVQKAYKKCKLIIAGKGRIDDGKELVNKLNLEDKIVFTGWLSNKDMHKMLSIADIFCLPSYCEGVPMSILEAMAYGLPVIYNPCWWNSRYY